MLKCVTLTSKLSLLEFICNTWLGESSGNIYLQIIFVCLKVRKARLHEFTFSLPDFLGSLKYCLMGFYMLLTNPKAKLIYVKL